jgi:hypothetical protein
MDQEKVKRLLFSLYECAEDFTVIFSGRKSKKVNGLYKPVSREIIIHNLNFTVDDTLLYTAIHELAHHIMYTERGCRGSRSHTQAFWACFHDLLAEAKRAGIYLVHLDDDTQAALNEARELSRRIAELQRQLGRMLLEVYEGCREQGLRAEDFIENEAQISRKTSDAAIAAAKMELPPDIGADIQAALIQERDAGARGLMLAAAVEGKSVSRVKQAAKGPAPSSGSGAGELEREKGRLEKTIKSLTRRLLEVEQRIEELRSGGSGLTPWRAASDSGG